jgi:hypothetical protein
MELIQRASRQVKRGKGSLDAGVKKFQFILQKKISRLDFLFTHHFYCFFGVRESPIVDFFFINEITMIKHTQTPMSFS